MLEDACHWVLIAIATEPPHAVPFVLLIVPDLDNAVRALDKSWALENAIERGELCEVPLISGLVLDHALLTKLLTEAERAEMDNLVLCVVHNTEAVRSELA